MRGAGLAAFPPLNLGGCCRRKRTTPTAPHCAGPPSRTRAASHAAHMHTPHPPTAPRRVPCVQRRDVGPRWLSRSPRRLRFSAAVAACLVPVGRCSSRRAEPPRSRAANAPRRAAPRHAAPRRTAPHRRAAAPYRRTAAAARRRAAPVHDDRARKRCPLPAGSMWQSRHTRAAHARAHRARPSPGAFAQFRRFGPKSRRFWPKSSALGPSPALLAQVQHFSAKSRCFGPSPGVLGQVQVPQAKSRRFCPNPCVFSAFSLISTQVQPFYPSPAQNPKSST